MPYDIEEVTAEWDEAHDEATSVGNPADVNRDTDGHQLELGEKGEVTTLTIIVTSKDETAKETYTVKVKRLRNDDATLASLDVNPGSTLDPSFDGADVDVSVYETTVEYDVDEVTVTWEPSDESATAVASGDDADTGTDGHQLELLEEGGRPLSRSRSPPRIRRAQRVYTLMVNRGDGPRARTPRWIRWQWPKDIPWRRRSARIVRPTRWM